MLMFGGVAHLRSGMYIQWLVYLLLAGFFSAFAYGINELTNQPFWQTAVGVVLMSAVVFSAAALSLLITARKSHPRRQAYGELSFLILLLILGTILPLTLNSSFIDWSQDPIIALSILTFACLMVMAYRLLKKKKFTVWRLVIGYNLAATLLIMFAFGVF